MPASEADQQRSQEPEGNTQNGQDAGAENGQGREKRGRDRYGRDRGPRGERSERGDRGDRAPRDNQPSLDGFANQASGPDARPVSPMPAPHAELASATEAMAAATSAPIAEAAVAVAVHTPVPPPPAPRSPEPVMVAAGLPKVQSFTLPVETLVQVAEGTGLSWVNSDPAKIAAVQAAIAAEAKPIHVPRARPEPVQVDSGPLVLVETKRDLRNLNLPFENTSPN